jgi:undecaprenyl-diphosphatase
MDLNLFLFQKINNLVFKNFYLDATAIFFAKYFEFFFVGTLLFLLIFNYRKYFLILWYAFLSGVLSRIVLTEIIRHLYYHPRPFDAIPVNLLVPHESTASFPSGHAAFYFAVAFYLFFKNKKLGAYALISAFLISLGRVYIGIHWPFDIIGGFLVGLVSVFLILKIERRRKEQVGEFKK